MTMIEQLNWALNDLKLPLVDIRLTNEFLPNRDQNDIFQHTEGISSVQSSTFSRSKNIQI